MAYTPLEAHHVKAVARGPDQGVTDPKGRLTPMGASLPLLQMVITWRHVEAVETRLHAKYSTHRLTPPIKGGLPLLIIDNTTRKKSTPHLS